MSLQHIESVLRGEADCRDLDSFDLAFLLSTGHVTIEEESSEAERMLKAISFMPPHMIEAKMLADIMQKAWLVIGSDYIEAIYKSFNFEYREFNKKQYDKANKLLEGLGKKLWSEVKDKALDLIHLTIESAVKQITKETKLTKADTDERRALDLIEKRSRDHLKYFVEHYPSRYVKKEIERQVELFTNIALGTGIDTIQERLKRTTSARYWQENSNVVMGKAWNAAALEILKEKGYIYYQSVSQGDNKVCPVCFYLDGKTLKVDTAYEQSIQELEAKFGTFPRYPDIDRKMSDDLEGSISSPPYHPHCRCQIEGIFTDEGAKIVPDIAYKTAPAPVEQQALPGYKVHKNGVIELDLAPADILTIKTFSSTRLSGLSDAEKKHVKAILNHLQQYAPLRSTDYRLSFGDFARTRGWLGQASDQHTMKIDNTILFKPMSRTEMFKLSIREQKKRIKETKKAIRITKKYLDSEKLDVIDRNITKLNLDEHVKLLKEREQALELLQEGKIPFFTAHKPKAGVSNSGRVQSKGQSVIMHEWGHLWHAENEALVKDRFGVPVTWGYGYDSDIQKALTEKYKISGYSRRSFMETFTENFTAYMNGSISTMHPDMVEFFDNQFPKLSFGKRLRPDIYGSKASVMKPKKRKVSLKGKVPQPSKLAQIRSGAANELTTTDYRRVVIKYNGKYGTDREAIATERARKMYPPEEGYTVLRERYLCDETGQHVYIDKNGNRTKPDPKLGKRRRLDVVVVKDHRVVKCWEVTGKETGKELQLDFEKKVRKAGGRFIQETNQYGDIAFQPAKNLSSLMRIITKEEQKLIDRASRIFKTSSDNTRNSFVYHIDQYNDMGLKELLKEFDTDEDLSKFKALIKAAESNPKGKEASILEYVIGKYEFSGNVLIGDIPKKALEKEAKEWLGENRDKAWGKMRAASDRLNFGYNGMSTQLYRGLDDKESTNLLRRIARDAKNTKETVAPFRMAPNTLGHYAKTASDIFEPVIVERQIDSINIVASSQLTNSVHSFVKHMTKNFNISPSQIILPSIKEMKSRFDLTNKEIERIKSWGFRFGG